MNPTSDGKNYRWRFFRAGGFDQVRLDSGSDLLNLDKLDQKLWVALSCPTRGVEFDGKTLDLIDTDRDGRIRVPEILAAVKWAGSILKDPDYLIKGSPSLSLAAINDENPEGKQLLASARQILVNLGKEEADAISLEDTTDPKIFAQTKFNGDGVVPPEAAGDEATRAAINEIIACIGSEPDRCGLPGVTQAKVDQFFADAQAFSDWRAKAETDAANILPFGERTPEAVAIYNAVRAKIDDYFARSRLASFDSRALAALNRQESEYLAMAAKDMSLSASEASFLPLARVEADRPLPLKQGLNPAWAAAVSQFHLALVKPLLGEKATLTAEEWATISGKMAAHEAWVLSKAGASVEKLGLKRVRELLGGKTKETITALIAQDKALEPEANAIAAVEKLVRYCRDLGVLLNNFVAFRDFYTRRAKAIFQAGTLYLDGRACDLCVRVDDPGKHAALAGLAKTYLAYCDCSRLATGEKMTIAAAFTGGDSDNLMVGRNGVFYDRRGRDWDATITKVIENPISLRQAFWAPYKKLVRLIEEQVAKRAAAADAAANAKLSSAATSVSTADQAKAAEPKKVDVGTVAALGVAFGAIGTACAAFAGYLTGVLKLPFWQVCLAFAGMLLIISGPSLLIAWLKLRQRNLGPILDANGWAVNGRVRMNVPFGESLTAVAKLPPGAQTTTDDPFGERANPWPKLLAFAVVIGFIYSLLNYYGFVHQLSGGKFGQAKKTESTSNTNTLSGTVQLTNAPAK